MSDNLFFLSSLFFFFSAVGNIFYWLYLWQVKEYRSDRLMVHFRETSQGKKLFFNLENLTKILLLALFLVGVFDNQLIAVFRLLVFLTFFYSAINFFIDLIYKKVKYPIFSFKMIFIAVLTFIIVTFLYLFPLAYNFFWILLIDRVLFLIISFLMFILSIPSEIYKEYVVSKALHKRNKFNKLLVIGITGSYGKGSTKEILNKILSYKFKTLATFGTFNTPIGIAKTILEKLNKNTEIFIVEMGAYVRGEIKRMCLLVKPTIGILTAVNSQHLSLFGSLENIKCAKFELIEYLPPKGLALLNANNENTLDLWKKTKKNKIAYFSQYKNYSKYIDEKITEFDCIAKNIKVNKFNIVFDVLIKSKNFTMSSLKVNLVGRHNAEILLPGIYLADYLGMTEKEIRNSLKTIFPLKKTMEPYILSTGTVLIDDTYNANPSAVFAALSYMNTLRGKKALVLQPMIELGEMTHQAHYEIGYEIGKTCDYLILTNSNFYKDIQNGVSKAKRKCEILVLNPREASFFINNNFPTENDVVVFEGKESAFIFDLLDKKKVFN